MTTRPRTRSAKRNRTSKPSAAARATWKQPLVIAALGLALGAVVGSFVRSATEGKELLSRSSDRLKEQFGKFKDGVSELAVESYFQVGEAAAAGTDDVQDTDKPHVPNGVRHNSLVMSDSKL